jgi:phosphatidylinositol glycan class P protein
MYSFVGWISSFVIYLCFLAWALLPEKLLHSLGITYYPSRYYAIALPAYALVTYAFSGIAYIGWNMINTLDPEDLGTVYDFSQRRLNQSPLGRAPLTFVKCNTREGIPDIGDIDPLEISSLICRRK